MWRTSPSDSRIRRRSVALVRCRISSSPRTARSTTRTPAHRPGARPRRRALVGNVPAVPGTVALCPDVSGSMRSSVTGHRGSATSRFAASTSPRSRPRPSAEERRREGHPFQRSRGAASAAPQRARLDRLQCQIALVTPQRRDGIPRPPVAQRERWGARPRRLRVDNQSWADFRISRSRSGSSGTLMSDEWNRLRKA